MNYPTYRSWKEPSDLEMNQENLIKFGKDGTLIEKITSNSEGFHLDELNPLIADQIRQRLLRSSAQEGSILVGATNFDWHVEYWLQDLSAKLYVPSPSARRIIRVIEKAY